MGLVHDHEVEVPDAKAALAVARFVDQPHHGGVGRQEHPALDVLVGDQVDRRAVRQMGLEGIGRLVDQRHAVGQEQDPLDPVAAHQQVAQGNHGARLAGAGGHHQQGLAVVVALEGFGHGS